MRSKAAQLFKDSQSVICAALERFEDDTVFKSDLWRRNDVGGADGGGGDTRILAAGRVFEQAGVNFSEVYGTLPAEMSAKLTGSTEEASFFATGVSVVVHPLSPLVPTTHANLRYLEVADSAWFGGGIDLTPYYLIDEDVRHFHLMLRSVCERHDKSYYQRFKNWCDEYFYLPHRGETRGVGGIFFDYLGRDAADAPLDAIFSFVSELTAAFVDSYCPIVDKRRSLPYSAQQREFQTVRRGRYVEFNLLYDRGTLFGLKTAGRTSSILMSLPPLVRWQYESAYASGSDEARLIETLQNPRSWA